MQANPRSLDTLFNSQLRYVVPMFQRLYVWDKTPQWMTLWEDITEKANLQSQKQTSNPHYLGAVIIEGVRPNSPREVKRFLVIDGQQRLTTLQLLFCAFRDYARERDWKTLDRTTSRYIENADTDVMENPDEERYKLWPTVLNRKIFTDVMSAGSKGAVEQKHPLIRLKRKRYPEPRSKLVEGYLFFSQQIRDWITSSAEATSTPEENCAFSLLQALQQDFCVVEIALSEGDDSQEIFYSLNSQGRPLSQSDLLRSLIFMRAEKEKQDRDTIFEKYWSRFETDFWSQEISRAGRSYSRLDLGLRFFLMAKSGNLVDARRVNEEYRRWISTTPPKYATVCEELDDFSKHAAIFEKYEVVPSGLPSTDFRRVLRDLDVSTAMPLVMFLEADAGLPIDQVDACIKILESFIVRRALTGEETKEYNKLFVEVVSTLRSLESSEVLSGLQKKLLAGGGITRAWPSDQSILEMAISRPLFGQLRTPALRLILERLELRLRGKKSEEHMIPEGLQIEHVMPQKWAAHWPILDKIVPQKFADSPVLATDEFAELADSIRERNRKLHTLGNLTLLNNYLNPAAGHGSFELKKNEYAHSVLRLNRYFSDQETWDETSIEERGKMLGSLICEIWPRSVMHSPTVTTVSVAPPI